MPSRPLNFRQRDITAFVKAVKKAGENVARVEVDREGTIVAYVGAGNKAARPIKTTLERLIDAHDDKEASIPPKLRRV
jgi:hypothetical protein